MYFLTVLCPFLVISSFRAIVRSTFKWKLSTYTSYYLEEMIQQMLQASISLICIFITNFAWLLLKAKHVNNNWVSLTSHTNNCLNTECRTLNIWQVCEKNFYNSHFLCIKYFSFVIPSTRRPTSSHAGKIFSKERYI